ncbi:MAG: BamA/TamA family outer membrane protein [Myxococcales bacterium]|nr:BamA/TamA family outer membrane protein [Myxococcales bacterium]
MGTWRTSTGAGWWLMAAIPILHACASTLPSTRYGIDEIEIEGVEQVDEGELKHSLVLHERDWPWNDWSLFDDTVYERDLARIVRWYRARGFYDASIVTHEVSPPEALVRDRVSGTEPSCERVGEGEGCPLSIRVVVSEGVPIRVRTVAIIGDDELPLEVQQKLAERVPLLVGERFDEAVYDRSKRVLRQVLANATHARASVAGHVEVNQSQGTADVTFLVSPGPSCVFGPIRVEGNDDLSAEVIYDVSNLSEGQPFSLAEIEDAQATILSLGSFSAVDIIPEIPEKEVNSNVIPILIRVARGRTFRMGVGVGAQIGTLEQRQTDQNVAQWDVHILTLAESRNTFGNLEKLRAQVRPRLIFPTTFPALTPPQFGAETVVDFRKPAFVERRTFLQSGLRWDYGPDPNATDPSVQFQRHEIEGHLGPERTFGRGLVFTTMKVRGAIYLPDDDPNAASEYHTTLLEQVVHLDLRDNSLTPTKGTFFRLAIAEGGFFLPSSWDYLRFAPEVRGYVPLPGKLVLAGRIGLGYLLVLGADSDLQPVDQDLGPRGYRFFCGCSSSNRGYLPSRMGGCIDPVSGNQGGLLEWKANVELRAPVSEIVGLVVFADAGDVDSGIGDVCDPTQTPSPKIRLDRLHLSVGGGLRVHTPFGPIRADLGLQIPGAQILGETNARTRSEFLGFGALDFPGAFHITVGEAF